MKSIKSMGFSMLLILCAVAVFASCGSGAPKKPKGIILVEGDNATLTNDGDYTTIEFPDELTAEDAERYDTDLMGYLLASNGPISTDGTNWDGFGIYYYQHNSHQWLHQGQYEDPAQVRVSKIKKIIIANRYQRLKDFNTKMPLLDGSKEKKNDDGYQNEIRFGNNYYYFIEVVVRD
ncbi:MAG: hypothetical protein MJZ06_05475 [Bacteroidaceae bacterium]|nr:hypothetical protein [Bacteroidaceae bacterium]